ncbi:hypothetical protein DRJ17_00385 [Candidatus Woesearchaeota archaeon]|nr:MAG: hypothetical protein DRJ17_00385 [Candidatus Woesearchaeota archaeon]
MSKKEIQDRIYNLLMSEEEITWKSILYNAIKSEEMDPWDIDVSKLSARFLETIKAMKELNLNLPAKLIFASAILLRIKSRKLLKDDINALDQLLTSPETDEFYEELQQEYRAMKYPSQDTGVKLVPRTPQPRRRKVSIFDLVKALDKALEVKHRRPFKPDTFRKVEVPKKKIDISKLIEKVYSKIESMFKETEQVKFSQILPSKKKADVIYTFISLLHLANSRKINIEQLKHFGDITITKARAALEQPTKEKIEI